MDTADHRKIMIVDDDREFLGQVQEMLELSGYETQVFISGEEALRSVHRMQPDLILLDLKMDGKSGFEVTAELKADDETSHIPIIAMTAFYGENEVGKVIEDYGALCCLRKPIQPSAVISQIERVLVGSSAEKNH